MQEADYKRCTKCGETKPRSDFYKHRRAKDGLQTYCKACDKAKAREWNRANPKRHAENLKRWENENPERKRELRRKSHARNRDKAQERAKVQRDRYPEKYRARYTLHNAVTRGDVAKPSSCERCGKSFEAELIHGHHHDYSKPLEVEWLCRPCHWQEHGKEDSLSV